MRFEENAEVEEEEEEEKQKGFSILTDVNRKWKQMKHTHKHWHTLTRE